MPKLHPHENTWRSFMPRLPHARHENLDVFETQTSSWKLGTKLQCSNISDDMYLEKVSGHVVGEEVWAGSVCSNLPTTWKLRWVASPNFLMKTQMCFLPQLPHRRHQNLDELQAQTSSWKLRYASWEASCPNFITHDMKTPGLSRVVPGGG
jgi:hypothetical protein